MSWIYLLLAIGFEVSGTTCMKLSQGFERLTPSLFVFVFYGLSLIALTLAMKHIDLSVSYAVWAGVGTGLMAVVGVAWFGESVTLSRVIALAMIIAGVVMLNLTE